MGAPGGGQQTGPEGFPLPPGLGDQVNPVMASMAMQYGQEFAAKGGEELRRNLDKYVSIGKLRYYFAVDNTYVGKKLALLLFPFTHSDWSIKYAQVEPLTEIQGWRESILTFLSGECPFGDLPFGDIPKRGIPKEVDTQRKCPKRVWGSSSLEMSLK